MITFEDFVPEVKDRGGFFQRPIMEQLAEPLARANEWIGRENVEVVSVETVVLPNIHATDEEGSLDTQLRASGEVGTYWYQFIRVWYRAR